MHVAPKQKKLDVKCAPRPAKQPRWVGMDAVHSALYALRFTAFNQNDVDKRLLKNRVDNILGIFVPPGVSSILREPPSRMKK